MRDLNALQEEIILKNKNGINFILAASICWLLIAGIWYLPGEVPNKAMTTFFAMLPMLPLAFGLSKLFKTHWNIEDNPLNALGLWLNFAQLFYFPFVFIFFFRDPAQMPMALAIITGAHFFPYAWFYQTKGYAVIAGLIAVGSAVIGTNAENPALWVALFMVVALWILAAWIYADYRKVAVRTEKLPLDKKDLHLANGA